MEMRNRCCKMGERRRWKKGVGGEDRQRRYAKDELGV